MDKQLPNIFRNRKIVLILAFLALLALFMLAISLEGLKFEPGDIFDLEQGNALSSFLKLFSLAPILRIFIITLLVLGAIATIYVLSRKELRKMFLQRILQMIIFVALFILAITFAGRSGEDVGSTETPTPNAAPTALEIPQFYAGESEPAAELPSRVELPSGLVYVISLAMVLVVGSFAWTLWTRNRKTNLHELAEIAKAASDDIEAGFDIEDVILRCYVQMMSVVKRRRGLNRKEAMTPTEFAYWLEGAGLPGGPLHRLTRLFERVRYGAYISSNVEAREAADCLREIAAFCGEGHS